MARSINQVILLGRLTRDPEQRTTASGKNEPYNLVQFGLMAEVLARYRKLLEIL